MGRRLEPCAGPKKDTKNYKGEHNKKARSCVIANIASNNLVDAWRASHPHKREYTWHKAVRKINPTAQRARLDFILTCEELAAHVKDTGIELPDKISDHSGTWIEFDTAGIKRGPGLWRFNNSFLDDPEYIKIANEVIKQQTRIHAKSEMSDSQWEELQIEDYQYIELADDVDARTFFDCMLASIRGASMKYGAAKKREAKAEREKLERKIASTNRLINIRAEPEQELLEKLDTYMDLIDKLDENNSKDAVRKHRAKILLEGEKPTKYFCSLQKIVEKHSGITELHIEHEQKNGPPIIESIKDQAKIEEKICDFYRNLYAERDSTASAARLENFMRNSPLIKKLSQEQRDKLEVKISEAEVHKYLRGMRNNVAPGSSGYTGNFYKFFWKIIKNRVMQAIHRSKEMDSLSVTQKIGIVQIIPKADKDLKLLTNWRPLTLLNTFYKIISGVLANRLKTVLDYLIGPEQKGYVPDRFIGEVTRTTYNIFQYAKEKNLPGMILLIDFEKAFDSVSFKMIDATLEMFGFGKYYREWITILLKDFEACINNSGNISQRFPVKRGCRQGDPISGYLFILCIEVLSIALKSNDGIKAYKLVNALKHLLDQYADDLTLYLERSEVHSENTKNVKAVLDTLENFRQLSGLTVNRGKTMLTIFGCKETDVSLCKQLGIKWCTEFKLLGLWFDQTLENMNTNYDLAKKKVLAIANSWRNRYVSVYGKVCVVKTLMLPKLTHIATVLPTLKKSK